MLFIIFMISNGGVTHTYHYAQNDVYPTSGRLYYLVICNYIRPILGTGTDMLVIKKTCRPGGRL